MRRLLQQRYISFVCSDPRRSLEKKGGSALRRIILLVTAVALVVAMLAFTASPAFANPGLVSAHVGKTSVSVAGLVNLGLGGLDLDVLG